MRPVSLWLGPLLAVVIWAILLPSGQAMAITAAVACWCVVWWVFEPVPIPVTSLLPLAVFQLTGVLTASDVGKAYGSPLILLMLGGFILSRAMERCGAHRRLAVAMINLFGGNSSRQVVFGCMLAAATLSMWISNTATTLMLLPMALAIVETARNKALAMPLMLGIAYAASIGGIGTPIGTPPNLVFMQVYQQRTGETITFLEWMRWALPVVILLLPIAAFWLTRQLRDRGGFELPAVEAWSTAEKRVMLVFAITALAWITRQEPFGGWSQLTGLTTANDASVALLAVVLMFVIPDGRNGRLLDWESAVAIPWGVLLLFGGGICLATAFSSSGLSAAVGDSVAGLYYLPLWLLVLCICLGVTFLTETTSNTASTVLLMPILAAAALSSNNDPLLLMVPAAMSASCAFMLPVATAPNSIVYGSGYVSTRHMAREGVVLNLIGALVITSVTLFLLG